MSQKIAIIVLVLSTLSITKSLNAFFLDPGDGDVNNPPQDTTPPTISITSDLSGKLNGIVTITASDESTMNSMHFLIDSEEFGIDQYEPFQMDLNTDLYEEGFYTIKVTISDIYGNVGSDQKSIEINRANRYAVIVGIGTYKNADEEKHILYPLAAATKDADDWNMHLRDKMNFETENIFLYKDNEATRSSIVTKLQNLYLDSNYILAFTFSGHGSHYENGSTSYILAYDSPNWAYKPYDGQISDSDLTSYLADTNAGKIFVFIDACYSGHFIDVFTVSSIKSKIFATTAASFDEETEERSEKDNGHWTYYFLEISWQNHYASSQTVSMENVYDYIKNEMTVSIPQCTNPKWWI